MILDPLNNFLQKIYPSESLIGSGFGTLNLDSSGQFLISFHVFSEPVVEIKKWGVWGEDYNVLVVRFIVQGGLKLNIDCDDFSGLYVKSLDDCGGIFELVCENDSASQVVKLRFKTALFQGADSYFLD